jgi:hypothetical protein
MDISGPSADTLAAHLAADGISCPTESSRFARCPLGFLPGWFVLRIRRPHIRPPQTWFYLHNGSQTLPLTGDITPLQTAKNAVGLHLSAATVLDYVRFYLFAVHDQDSRFVPVETGDEVTWLAEEHDESAEAEARAFAAPLQLKEATTQGYHIEAVLALADTLYRCAILVHHDGTLDFSNPEPLAEQAIIPPRPRR